MWKGRWGAGGAPEDGIGKAEAIVTVVVVVVVVREEGGTVEGQFAREEGEEKGEKKEDEKEGSYLSGLVVWV